MLEQLKRLAVDVVQIEDLLAGQAFGKMLKAEFEEVGEDVPSWLDDKLRMIGRAIDAKLDERRALKIRELEGQLDRLTPAAEKRVAVEKQLKALKRQHRGDQKTITV